MVLDELPCLSSDSADSVTELLVGFFHNLGQIFDFVERLIMSWAQTLHQILGLLELFLELGEFDPVLFGVPVLLVVGGWRIDGRRVERSTRTRGSVREKYRVTWTIE